MAAEASMIIQNFGNETIEQFRTRISNAFFGIHQKMINWYIEPKIDEQTDYYSIDHILSYFPETDHQEILERWFNEDHPRYFQINFDEYVSYSGIGFYEAIEFFKGLGFKRQGYY